MKPLHKLLNKPLLVASTLILSSTLIQTVQAAQFTSGATRDGGGILKLSGDIDTNDGNQLRSLLNFAQSNGIQIHTIELNSLGGSAYDGADLAVVVHEAGLKTRVLSDSTCASACFTVYAAGAEREYEKGARIGVHSIIDAAEGENHIAKAYTVDMLRFLDALGVPASILGKLAITEPQFMTWLTDEDLRLMTSYTSPANHANENYVEEVAPQVQPEAPARSAISSKDLERSRQLNDEAIKLLRNYEAAIPIELLFEANELNPYDVEILGNLGYALFLNHNYEDARDVLALALRIKPDRGSSWHNLGLAVAFLGDTDWATECFVNYYKHSSRKKLAQDQLSIWINESEGSPEALTQAAKNAYQILGL
ncbi:MAG: hypothetical protein Q4G54_06600 [Pelistega sp.]|nr:hypothetical protein [Pelistega sp.]